MLAASDFPPISVQPCVEHPGEDDLEAYSRRQLAEPACCAIEEHLLVCEACQVRLTEIDAYSLTMRDALKALDKSQ